MSYGPGVTLDKPAYIDPTTRLYGRVTVGEGASFWPYTVARAENFEVVVGPYTNIQDFAMLHVGATTGTYIGAWCSITHHCTIHGCTIGDNCLIGINATIMDGAVIGDNCIIAGGAFVTEGTQIPANSIVMGAPAKVKRTQNMYVRGRLNAWLYWQNALAYAKGHHRRWDDPDFQQAMNAEQQRLAAQLEALS